MDVTLTSEVAVPEEWRAVPSFPSYRVSNYGRVQSRVVRGSNKMGDNWWDKRPWFNAHGYMMHDLCADGRRHHCFTHHLVLLAFVGPRPDGMHGCHGDGNSRNNWVGNLRWDTPASNEADKTKHGTRRIHERHPRAKLTALQVVEIRTRRSRGEKLRTLAAEFGVSVGHIGNVTTSGKVWQHE